MIGEDYDEFTAASLAQHAEIESVNAAIDQMSSITQQNSSLVDEAAQTAQLMRDEAAKLSASMSICKLNTVEGSWPPIV